MADILNPLSSGSKAKGCSFLQEPESYIFTFKIKELNYFECNGSCPVVCKEPCDYIIIVILIDLAIESTNAEDTSAPACLV